MSTERRLGAIEDRLEKIEDQLTDHHRHLKQISKQLEIIMSKISEFAANYNAFIDRQDAAVTALKTSLDGVGEDVTWLKAKIEELQNTPGDLSKADQDLLDAIEQRLGTMATNSEDVATKAAALDALTPPQVPNTP